MKPIPAVLIPAACLALSACGGDGASAGLASTPAPVPAQAQSTPPTTTSAPTPLPPTPATTTGTYQTISTFTASDASKAVKVTLPGGQQTLQGVERVVDTQLAPAGSVSIAVNAATRTYTLTAAVGPFQFPSDQMTMSATSDLGYTRNRPIFGPPDQMTPEARAARGDLVSHTVPSGTTADGLPRVTTSFVTLYNVGQLDGSPRYLSVAQWGQLYQENANGVLAPGNVRPLQITGGVMVFGPRTEPGDMPLSGRASYTLHSIINPPSSDEDGNVYDVLGKTVLDVDFGTKKLSGRYDQTWTSDSYQTDDDGNQVTDKDGNPILSEHIDAVVRASGSVTLGNDSSFTLPLTGNGTVHTVRVDEPPISDIVKPVTGSLNGAFFGPQAAEVGGIAQLPQIGSDGSTYQIFTDFAGVRTAP